MASVKEEDLIFGEICRCCMACKPRMKPLFDTNLHTMLTAVTGLQLHQNDGLPSQLCVPCVLQVRRAHFFKVQCEKIDSTLRSYMVESKFTELDDQEFSEQPLKRVKQESPEANSAAPRVNDDNVDGANGEPNVKREKLYICPQCPKSFELERKLKRHMRIHISQRPHACPECDMTFVEKSNLSKHMRKHTGELRNSTGKPHLCAECGKSFKYSTSLSRHKRLHANRNLFTCQICFKSYVEQQTLRIHMRTHTNERPYPCPTCDKSFSQKVNLERHERTHTGEKPYSCDVCGNCFTQKSYLVIHKRIHTHEKPYECPNCTARFISRNAMMKHQRTPCSHKPHWCTFCKKSFRYKKCLRTHRRTHLLESPHACQYCESRFLRAVKLAAHMKAKHPQVEFNVEDYAAPETRHVITRRMASTQTQNSPARGHALNSEYEDTSEGEELEDEEYEIDDVSMYEEDQEEEEEECGGQRMQDVEEVRVMINGDGEPEVLDNSDEQEDRSWSEVDPISKHEPLLAIKIMNPGEDDSDIEQ